ncbi:hypothetical protein M8C21_016696 [Ambrosia artemisiifolia]|uniref:Uncharacterized protein n=1 Tax=Ambrosia artemisiifolia TaxID=4212 RepID=A0AAD5BMB4_AMBAR|nr:hypothetical protein M8C21_016696 [Ambrosia artemisiifolia]
MNATKLEEVVIFLDYDGSLSPIVKNHDQAHMAPEMFSDWWRRWLTPSWINVVVQGERFFDFQA